MHTRCCILLEFQHGKDAKKKYADRFVPLYDVCAFWFERLKSGNFGSIDERRSGGPQMCNNDG